MANRLADNAESPSSPSTTISKGVTGATRSKRTGQASPSVAPSSWSACLRSCVPHDADGNVGRHAILRGTRSLAGAVEQQHRDSGDATARRDPLGGVVDDGSADGASGRHELSDEPGRFRAGNFDGKCCGRLCQPVGTPLEGSEAEQQEPRLAGSAQDQHRGHLDPADLVHQPTLTNLGASLTEPLERPAARTRPGGDGPRVVGIRYTEWPAHSSHERFDHLLDRRGDQRRRSAPGKLECRWLQIIDPDHPIQVDGHCPCRFKLRQLGSSCSTGLMNLVATTIERHGCHLTALLPHEPTGTVRGRDANRPTASELAGSRPNVTVGTLDLNLLPALQALLEERHVTRAAQRVNLSQPAMSDVLGRLRRYFDDELLVRRGNQYELTRLAVTLLPRVSDALDEVQRVANAEDDFDPSTSERTFDLVATSYALAVIVDPLAARLRREAPRTRLRVRGFSSAVRNLDEVVRGTDGIVIPESDSALYQSVPLFDDRWVLIAAAGSELARRCVGRCASPADLEAGSWVVSFDQASTGSPVGYLATALGISPRADLLVEDFLVLPMLVAESDRIALVQERTLRLHAPLKGVEIISVPVTMPPLRERFWWHPSQDRLPDHRWLRWVITEVAADL